MSWDLGVGGIETLTTTGAVLASGVPIRLFSAHWTSGASAGPLVLHNGTSTTATLVLTAAGVANASNSLNFENGLPFPSGCYFNKNVNVTSTTLCYVKEL